MDSLHGKLHLFAKWGSSSPLRKAGPVRNMLLLRISFHRTALETTCLQTGSNTEFPIGICNLNLWKQMFAQQLNFCTCTNMFTTSFVCCMVLQREIDDWYVFVFPIARVEYIDLIYAVWDKPVFTHHGFRLAHILGPCRWPGEDFPTIRIFNNS